VSWQDAVGFDPDSRLVLKRIPKYDKRLLALSCLSVRMEQYVHLKKIFIKFQI